LCDLTLFIRVSTNVLWLINYKITHGLNGSSHYQRKTNMKTIQLTPSLSTMVDQLGQYQAEIKELTVSADDIKAQLKLMGTGDINGTVYGALVYESKGRTVTDWRTIAETLGASNPEILKELIKAHTDTGDASLAVRVSIIKAAEVNHA
jgi:hypothetical protein